MSAEPDQTPDAGQPAPGTAPDAGTASGSGAEAGGEDAGVTPVELGELQPAEANAAAAGVELLRDIEITVTVEVGRARMRVKDLLGLHDGSVIELDRPVGSPVDLLANGRPIAKGEIVLVEEQLGLRVTSFDVDEHGG